MTTGSTVVWHLYMVEMASGALYTGITTDVGRRLAEHRAGRGAKALRGKGPLTLVHQQCMGSHNEALRLEAAIKRLSAARKRRWLAETGGEDRPITPGRPRCRRECPGGEPG